jgi:hypothetical protein
MILITGISGFVGQNLRSFLKKTGKDRIFALSRSSPPQDGDLSVTYPDLQFIFMSPEMEGHGFPSKVYTIMACAKPILVCSGENTPIYKFLHHLGCAYLISEKDNTRKLKSVVELLKSLNRESLKLKGKLGLEEILTKYTNHAVTQKYVELADSLLALKK